ncbi:MAG: DUF4097 family beta strand repeat protein [Ignavibacteriae bacterium]|nr:DUF4097 family beta strand repeat protein [Ignavibacteriota bacterium]
MKRHHIMLVSIVATLLLIHATTMHAGERKIEKKFSVTPGGTLSLESDLGTVAVSGTPANEVSVVALLRGATRDVEEFELTATQTANGVEVKGRARGGARWFFWNWNDLDIQFTVRVPREYNLNVNTAGGDISVVNVKGRVSGETSGGDLRLSDIEGEITLNTSGGDIQTEKTVGNVRMETSGGSIRLAAVTGNVEVSTSGGNIHVNDVDGKVRAETSGGDVIVTLRETNKGVQAETSGGDIEIFVGKNISANIDAATSGGEVTCDLPITMSGKISESRIRGSVNGGGNTIYAHTSGGDVRIGSVR